MKLLNKLVIATLSACVCVSLIAPTSLLANSPTDPCGCAVDLGACQDKAANTLNSCVQSAQDAGTRNAFLCLALILPPLIAGCEAVAAGNEANSINDCNDTYDTSIANCMIDFHACVQKCG